MLRLMKSDAYMERIREGAYQQYWGPWTRGVFRFVIGDNPDFRRKMLGVLTATEGGRYGAVNMYDRCILTVGLIQWCEAANIFGVTKMLKKCFEADKDLLTSYMSELPGDLLFTGDGFIFNGKPVKTKADQRAAFLGGSSGKRGQWTEAQKKHAWRVCAVMSAIWSEEKFRAVQEEYTAKRLLGFVMPKTKKMLFKEGYPTEGAAGALRCAVMSYAGNLPANADKHFRRAAGTIEYQEADDLKKLVIVMEEMAFGSGIGIWPHRYNAIRPVLEKQFGIDLPDFAEQLRTFEEKHPWFEHFPDDRAIQEALIFLGADLGPAGADGRFGPKSRAALKAFEISSDEYEGKPDGIPDVKSMDALWIAWQAAKEADATLLPTAPVDDKPDDDAFDDTELIADVGVVVVEGEDNEPEVVDEDSDPEPFVVEGVNDDDSEGSEALTVPENKSKAPYVVLVVGAVLAALGRLLGWY
jgi:hypothetical protein